MVFERLARFIGYTYLFHIIYGYLPADQQLLRPATAVQQVSLKKPLLLLTPNQLSGQVIQIFR